MINKMKHMKQTILYVLTGLFLLAGCRQEETPEAVATGYWVIDGLQKAVAEETPVNGRGIASVDESETWYVDITNASSEVVVSGQEVTTVSGKIALPEGQYTVSLYDAADKENTPNRGKYCLTGASLQIRAEEVTYAAYEVPLVNFAVRLALPPAFSDYFSGELLQVTVDSPGAPSYHIAAGETAYFDYQEGIELRYTLGALNADNESVTTAGTYPKADEAAIAPGHCYVITYAMPGLLQVVSGF